MNQREKIIKKIKTHSLTLSDFDNHSNLITNLINQLKPDLIIGEGGSGIVYRIDNYAIKESKQYFNIKEITDIPGGGGKYRYILSHILVEILCGMLMDELHFSATIASAITTSSIYLVMEHLTPITKLPLGPITFTYFLFQTAYALMNAQKKYKFTHYDLHVGNILFDQYPKNIDKITYTLPNSTKSITFSKSNFPFIVKISDFDQSRMEVDNVIITSDNKKGSTINYSEFNYNYDFICLLGSLLADPKFIVFYWLEQQPIFYVLLKLILYYFNEPSSLIKEDDSITQYYRVKNMMIKKYYSVRRDGTPHFRPKMTDHNINFVNTKSLVQVVNWLAEGLQQSGFTSSIGDSDTLHIEHFNFYPIFDKIKIYEDNNKIVNIMDGVMLIKKYIEYELPPSDYNFTIETDQLSRCPLQRQIMTVVHVDARKLNKMNINYECCKLDPVNMLLYNKNIGFIINAGFFDIKGDFLPIGPYKDRYSIINEHPIPQNYLDDYGFIALNNNTLSILDKVKESQQICASGPILIKKGKVVFDPYYKRFMCTDAKFARDKMIAESDNEILVDGYDHFSSLNRSKCIKNFIPFTNIYSRCNKIPSGYLSHADNPNPRSVLCIMPNGDYLFITFQGRGMMGDGVDLFAMSHLILKLFPTVTTAINLDGGRSSVIAWRTGKDGTVWYNQPLRPHVYPNGNVICVFNK